MRGMILSGLAAMALAGGAASAATLVHDYEFSAATVIDSIGGVNGTLYGDANVSGGYLNLDGDGDYVELAGKIVPLSGDFSIYFSYAGATVPGGYGIAEVISQGYSTQPGFYIGQNGGTVRLTDYFAGGVGSFPTGSGSHGILVTSGVAGTTVYVDGANAFSTASTIYPGDSSGSNTRFGRQFAPFDEYFQGKLDNVRFYSGIASYSEASAGTNSTAPEPESWALMVVGFGMIGGALRRARRFASSFA